jgi:hypothetical protein
VSFVCTERETLFTAESNPFFTADDRTYHSAIHTTIEIAFISAQCAAVSYSLQTTHDASKYFAIFAAEYATHPQTVFTAF